MPEQPTTPNDGAEPPRDDSTGRPPRGQGNEKSAFLAIGMAFFVIGMSQGLGDGGAAFFAIGVAFIAIGLSGVRGGDADPHGPGDATPPGPIVPRHPQAQGEESPSGS